MHIQSKIKTLDNFKSITVRILNYIPEVITTSMEDKDYVTFVAGLFMVYTNFLTKLDGLYCIDPPPNALREPYINDIKQFSQFLLIDAKKY